MRINRSADSAVQAKSAAGRSTIASAEARSSQLAARVVQLFEESETKGSGEHLLRPLELEPGLSPAAGSRLSQAG